MLFGVKRSYSKVGGATLRDVLLWLHEKLLQADTRKITQILSPANATRNPVKG